MNRRQFIGKAGGTALALLSSGKLLAGQKQNGEFLFVEAEQFSDYGGWDLDQQSMDVMGSPYLLAHGLGIPVENAKTEVTFPSAGKYRVWVRTKDWVAPWDAPGAPGKFKLLINGEEVEETFGTKSAEWHWHDGGIVEVTGKSALEVKDLTGFEGRFEAILFCKDTSFTPTNDVKALDLFRRKLLNLPDKPKQGDKYDLVVVGGGLAGICAAISAARNDLKVALVQDRPVLGGNASSEVRVWPAGKTKRKPYPHVGDITEELIVDFTKELESGGRTGTQMNGGKKALFDDDLKMKVVTAEPNITLYMNHRSQDVITENSAIKAVVIQSTLTAERTKIYGNYFADCTGDAKVGFLAGADYEYDVEESKMGSTNLFSVLDASDKEAVLKCECKDKAALAMKYELKQYEQPFPRCPWAHDLSDKPFPGRAKFSEGLNLTGQFKNVATEGLAAFERKWYWESGFDQDQIEEIELIRDNNFRAMYGAWDALKNVDGLYPNHRLGWSAFIAGKRESRRLMGDVIITADDFKQKKKYTDACVPCSWFLDIHYVNAEFQKGFEGTEFLADYTRGKDYHYKGIYWIPYRCLYSRNVSNLFMAGRDISVSKSGLGAVRVMKTTGMMGEIVGKAAAVCIQEKTSPRGVYEKHLPKLKRLMKEAS